jgi:hypothetical protein
MFDVVLDLITRNAALIQALAAIVSVTLLIPSAFVFLQSSREQRHKYVMEQYRDFLTLVLQNPELSLESAAPNPGLQGEARLKRDVLFDILTTAFERAFFTYFTFSSRFLSYRKSQKHGWEDYIRLYAARPDYVEYWSRCMFEDDKQLRFKTGTTQFDRNFEKFMFDKLREPMARFEADGQLALFAPRLASPETSKQTPPSAVSS